MSSGNRFDPILTNTRLKSELAGFDLGFFEEVEDLKYSYAKLKREAEKMAKGKVRSSAELTLDEKDGKILSIPSF